jgi:leucine-rich repeat protein SHOC2
LSFLKIRCYGGIASDEDRAMRDAEIERAVRADIRSIVDVINCNLRWKLIQEIGIERLCQEFELEQLTFDDLFMYDYHVDCEHEDSVYRYFKVKMLIVDAYISNSECLNLYGNEIVSLPNCIEKLSCLRTLDISYNRLQVFPTQVFNLVNLTSLDISDNEIASLPSNLGRLYNIKHLNISINQIVDLSPLQGLPERVKVDFIIEDLPRRYWTKICDWQASWLLDEPNYEIRKKIIKNIGFDRIYSTLNLEPLNFDDLIVVNLIIIDTDIDFDISNYSEYDFDISDYSEYDRSIGDNSPIELKIVDTYIRGSNNLSLANENISSLPNIIGSLDMLTDLYLDYNYITQLPPSFSNLSKLEHLDLGSNRLQDFPSAIDNFLQLKSLTLRSNQISKLPQTIANLSKLEFLDLNDNPIDDLSILQSCSDKLKVRLFDIYLSRRYWIKFSEWKPEWLLDENNVEIRRMLIHQVGYERICQELETEEIDRWQEYSLLKIDKIERVYDWDREELEREPMVLLKMTCPSTAHIHVLRVPPDMTSAEAAITWVNHGIHPDRFAVQT